ncbi:MAG TPA: bifunctional helix-turn-helix transcriptional regulator/GNAT family N-acetyltransferase [Candidatus Acidoferrales bacterium]|nr:bifunctional helix-turn-helix transcriptional regulator/GNAT family N-acetyltransferase [Candidatus Acidoferrales bacterium]
MPQPALHQRIRDVRRFSRFYTAQIGALRETLYRSSFSLAQVRVLYELAHRETTTAAVLARELGLDPGYLSRILRQFAQRRLLERSPSPADRRESFLSLTPRGRKTFAPLDRRSDAEVGALLESLPSSEQSRLVAAMRAIESILGPRTIPSAPYVLRQHQPGDMGWVTHRHGVLYNQEYGYNEEFEALVAGIVADFIRRFDAKRERCWIAEREGEILGCVFLVKKSKTIAKLRLLLVEPQARGLGIGRRLVGECVRFARQSGYRKITLWTQSDLYAARHLYREVGFRPAGRERHHSFGKDLIAETWDLEL